MTLASADGHSGAMAAARHHKTARPQGGEDVEDLLHPSRIAGSRYLALLVALATMTGSSATLLAWKRAVTSAWIVGGNRA